MKFNRAFFLAFAASLTMLLTACGGGPQAANWPGMSTDGENVYLADGQFVHIVQLSDGKPKTTSTPETPDFWQLLSQMFNPTPVGLPPLRFPLKADATIAIYTTPVLTGDGQLIVGNAATEHYQLFSVDPSSVQVNWSFDEAKGSWLGSALVTGDTILAASSDGKVYALDLKGQKRWESTVSQHALWSAPVTDGKQVFISTLDHQVVALDLQTGKQSWKVVLDTSALASPALTVDGVLYIGTLSGNLYALKTSDGSKVWDTVLDGNIWSTPVIDGDTLYVGTSKGTAGELYALKTADGQKIWSHDETGSIVASPLVLPEQIVYVTETGHIQSLNKNNTPKWQADIAGAKIYTAPMFAGGVILIAPMQAQFSLVAYDPTGLQKWTFSPVR